jgi:hypothetical protein
MSDRFLGSTQATGIETTIIREGDISKEARKLNGRSERE